MALGEPAADDGGGTHSRAHPPHPHHLPGEPGRAAPRGRLHPHHLVQALVLLHVPRARARAARHRLGRDLRGRVAPIAPRRHRHRRHDLRAPRRGQHRGGLPRRGPTAHRHPADLGLRHQGLVQEPGRSRARVLHALRVVHRDRDHRRHAARPSHRPSRPLLLRGPDRRRPRRRAGRPADLVTRTARSRDAGRADPRDRRSRDPAALDARDSVRPG